MAAFFPALNRRVILPTEVYDFFIAHAGADAAAAERLFDLLSRKSRVFLDTRCLKFGDPWDVVLPKAQRDSRVTVVIVSPHTEAAFYQREEVAAAIDLARRARHRVVPVVIDGPLAEDAVPYGLRRLHRAEISKRFTLSDLAMELLTLKAAADPRAIRKAGVPPIASDERILIREADVEIVKIPDPLFPPVLPEGRAHLDITDKKRLLLQYTSGRRVELHLFPIDPGRRSGSTIELPLRGTSIVFKSPRNAVAVHKVMLEVTGGQPGRPLLFGL